MKSFISRNPWADSSIYYLNKMLIKKTFKASTSCYWNGIFKYKVSKFNHIFREFLSELKTLVHVGHHNFADFLHTFSKLYNYILILYIFVHLRKNTTGLLLFLLNLIKLVIIPSGNNKKFWHTFSCCSHYFSWPTDLPTTGKTPVINSCIFSQLLTLCNM